MLLLTLNHRRQMRPAPRRRFLLVFQLERPPFDKLGNLVDHFLIGSRARHFEAPMPALRQIDTQPPGSLGFVCGNPRFHLRGNQAFRICGFVLFPQCRFRHFPPFAGVRPRVSWPAPPRSNAEITSAGNCVCGLGAREKDLLIDFD